MFLISHGPTEPAAAPSGVRALRGVPRAAVAWLWSAVRPHWLVIRLLPRVSPGLTVAIAVCVAFGAALPVIMTVATGALVGSIPAAVAAGPDSAAAGGAFRALLVLGVLFVGARALGTVRATLGSELGRRLDEHLRERVMVAMNRPIGIAHLEDPQLRDHIERAQGIVSGYTAGIMVNPLANWSTLWLQSIGSAILLARFNAVLAVVLFVTWAIAGHFLRSEYVRSIVVAEGLTKHARRANYLRDLVMKPGGGKEVRLWGLLGWLTNRYTEERWRVIGPMGQERTRGDRVHLAASASGQVAGFVVTAAVALAVVRGDLDLRALATYLGAVAGVAIIGTWPDAFELAYGTRNVPAVLELERRTAEAHTRETLAGTIPVAGLPRQSLCLEGVTFRYPGGDTPALERLDLFIPAGKSLAIVGENGAGKTTLVKLLARLYDPTEGRITVDGVPLTTLEPRAWQRRVSAIFQDFTQYRLTARDNVAFGAVERLNDEAALVEAARRSSALDVVEGLPRGWETVLSRQYKGGADLSGGQWQRLALARALFAVAAGASVLILDEPTANLDVRAEAALYDRFLDITHGLTTVLISHRFSTVRRADRIAVLDRGRVTEQGTHDELLALGGRYAAMFTLQAARFLEEEPRAAAVEQVNRS